MDYFDSIVEDLSKISLLSLSLNSSIQFNIPRMSFISTKTSLKDVNKRLVIANSSGIIDIPNLCIEFLKQDEICAKKEIIEQVS